MSNKRRCQEEWEQLLVGKSFNWLTVLSIEPAYYKGKRRGYFAVCQCKCGKVIKITTREALNGLVYSCGCYKSSKEFILKQHTWQSDKDKHNKSIQKNKQHYIDHPEKILNISEKNKQYWSNNPDKVKSRAEKHHQYNIEHPECRSKLSEKRKQYFIDHSDAKDNISKSLKEYYKNNPDKIIELSDKYKEWFINNHDDVSRMIKNQNKWRSDKEKVISVIEKRKKTLSENPSIQNCITHKFKVWALKRRKNFISEIHNKDTSDFEDLLNIIHPDYVGDLLNGNIKANDVIKTKCPVCNEYAEHSFNNVFILGKGIFKYGHSLLCDKCNKSISHSRYEDEIEKYISTFYSGTCERNVRNIISPLELDLYYPDKNIAIEFNGDHWHDDNHKSNDYHYNKYLRCKEKGVLLVSIFESHWNTSKDDIKSYLKDLFNDKENNLSFKDGLMNNNYPSKAYFLNECTYIDDSYTINDSTIHTCGYSKFRV